MEGYPYKKFISWKQVSCQHSGMSEMQVVACSKVLPAASMPSLIIMTGGTSSNIYSVHSHHVELFVATYAKFFSLYLCFRNSRHTTPIQKYLYSKLFDLVCNQFVLSVFDSQSKFDICTPLHKTVVYFLSLPFPPSFSWLSWLVAVRRLRSDIQIPSRTCNSTGVSARCPFLPLHHRAYALCPS